LHARQQLARQLHARPQQYEAPAVAGCRPRPSASPSASHLLTDDVRPLRIASVRADTVIAHPKPIAHPLGLGHNIADRYRWMPSGPAAGNVAQLEATAERLSMTSSIDDAIRDLHSELKRSDSRRAAALALSPSARASVNEAATSYPAHLARRLSSRASIVSINSAARHGGYSPAAFVMSPSTSLSSRLRSGSAMSPARVDAALDYVLCRQSTGKSSVRSARSGKPSLAEISESDPVSLTQQAFDEADAAPPLEEVEEQTTAALQEDMTSCHGHVQRSESLHSINTLEQARDAFIDFDGVHCESQHEQPFLSHVPHILNTAQSSSPQPESEPEPVSMTRPASYIDPSTGTKMLYYPARVPAMLNLPPKLSTKPKVAVRDQRRSQLLSAMMDGGAPDISTSSQRHRQSTHANFGPAPSSEAPARDSWLPDPLANHRDSFAALASFGGPLDAAEPQTVASDATQPSLLAQQEPDAHGEAVPDHMRRPEKLSKEPMVNRKSIMSMPSNLSSQLRASAFFDLPSVAPDVEIKDGSAMATLDSILDASTTAPVSAFTDHVYAGKLGTEVYGKQKKQTKTRPSAAAGQALASETPEPPPKKRSSFMWLGKNKVRCESQEEEKGVLSSLAMTSTQNVDVHNGGEGNRGEQREMEEEAAEENEEEEEEEEEVVVVVEEEEEEDQEEIPDESYQGPPTTLLAELQLRKQQQKERVRNMGKGLPNGNYATLLEMDTVAETQRKNRQSKRVNLAWEGIDSHVDQNGSDDEDVPLAIIAAMQRGAKNLADLERPLGLMERREIEDNEPLSHRRARLQGIEPPSPQPALAHRQSTMSLSATRRLEISSLQPEVAGPDPESQTPEVEEIEGETLGDRRHRLAVKDGELPKARPVSSAFSAELLSHFGDTAQEPPKQQAKDGNKGEKTGPVPDAGGEEETLGQRRRRLKAEREARDREMGGGNLAGAQSRRDQDDDRPRVSLANVLSVHPRREADARMQEEKLRQESGRRAAAAQDRESKMAALRTQMPTVLPQPNIERSGGYRGGALNDGTGGQGFKAALSSSALNLSGYGLSPGNRASVMSGPAHGAAKHGSSQTAVGRQAYGGAMSVCGAPSSMVPYRGMNSMSSMCNLRPASQLQTVSKSMDRVEQWRYSVRP
ncbi:hypothetical protein E4U41_003543, partial [Claviceps citrina]